MSESKSKLKDMFTTLHLLLHCQFGRVTARFLCSLVSCICFVLFATACVPSAENTGESSRTRIEPVVIQVQQPELPILYEALELPYTLRQSEQPTGLPDLIMLNNSVAINSVTTEPLEQAIDVYGLLVDAGIFGGKFLLRLTLYLDVDDPSDSFAMHQFDSLVLKVDGQTIPLSRDTNDIGISKQQEGGYIEFGFYTAFPNLYLILANAKNVRLELIGGKDGIDRKLIATFNQENKQRYAEFHRVFDETYR